MLKPSVILQRVLDLVVSPDQLTCGVYGRDKDGNPSQAPNLVSWCTVGAVAQVLYDEGYIWTVPGEQFTPDTINLYNDTMRHIRKAARLVSSCKVTEWSDRVVAKGHYSRWQRTIMRARNLAMEAGE